MACDPAQQLAPEPARQRFELRACPARGLELAHRQEDLHGGGEQGRAPMLHGRLAEHSTHRGRRRVAAPLSEAQESEARLRLAPEVARVAIRTLCIGQVAPNAMELSLAVERIGGRTLVEAGGEPLAGAPRLEQRVVPVTGQLQDLGPVHEAPPLLGPDQVRLAFAPPAERGSPLLCPTDLVDLLAGEDHTAIHEPGDDRRELVRRERHHGFVEEGESLGDPTAGRQHLPLCVGRKGEEVLVAEAPSDRRGGARRGGRRLPVACRPVPEHVGNQRVAALDAIPLALEEPLCAPEPARGRPHLAAQHVVDADPARTVRGTASPSSLDYR